MYAIYIYIRKFVVDGFRCSRLQNRDTQWVAPPWTGNPTYPQFVMGSSMHTRTQRSMRDDQYIYTWFHACITRMVS